MPFVQAGLVILLRPPNSLMRFCEERISLFYTVMRQMILKQLHVMFLTDDEGILQHADQPQGVESRFHAGWRSVHIGVGFVCTNGTSCLPGVSRRQFSRYMTGQVLIYETRL
jgi:hypothetical protein